jgi:trehalose 6-phosphate synthase
MRLLTCSNSGPRLASGDGSARVGPAAPGGLVPILAALLDEVGGQWIYSAPGVLPHEVRERESWSSSGAQVRWQPLPIDQVLMESQRESITIKTMLWTFHYLHDTATAPSFADDLRQGWQAYDEVNRQFADALVGAHQDGADEVVLVHDFHLMLVAGHFAARTPGRNGRLAYFHHVPWCGPDYFGLLPDWIAIRILESLLACDFVGFHCDRWADAFIACVDRFLPEAAVTGRIIAYRGHETAVTVAPGPVDAAVLDELDRHPSTERWRESLRARAGDRRVVVRVDRMDLWKNLVRGFSAYQALLARRPATAAEVWFCAIVSMPRLTTERHREYQALCEDLVRSVNDRYGAGREAISLIYPEGPDSQRNRSVAALSIASATLVNPTFDGLNMVAKEAVVVNPGAPLLLSVNTGAFPQLAGHATALQPFDVSSTTDALEAALFRSTLKNGGTAGAAVRAENAGAWLQTILHAPRN